MNLLDLYPCDECKFDHAIQPDQSYNAHMKIIANHVADMALNYANKFNASKITRLAIEVQVAEEIRKRKATLNPTSIADKVCLMIKNQGIGVKYDDPAQDTK